MFKGYMDAETYNSMLFEEGIYYPIIFYQDKEIGKFFIFMPIKDCNENMDIGEADSFEEAYAIAQNYLNSYHTEHHKYPKYVNPYNIDTDDNEILVMVKYS